MKELKPEGEQVGNRLDMLYFSSIDWNSTWQRPQQLASRLAKHGQVLYINPFGLRKAEIKDIRRLAGRAAFRLTHRTANATNQPLAIYTPMLYFPFPDSRTASILNVRLLLNFVRVWMERHHIFRPIIWAGTPSSLILKAVASLSPRALVYDCLDNFACFHEGQSSIASVERQLASQARVVFATARELYDRMSQINPHTILLPNAADFQHFAQARRPLILPDDMAGIRKPVLGYVGEIAHWFDFELVHDLALKNPNWSIVLIGQTYGQAAQHLFELPNIYYLGRKDYEKLPAYLSQFDVCLLPFKINALTSAVNPVKLYEYLAAGKPVVSTPLNEVAQHGETVFIADRSNWADAVAQALKTARDETQITRRQSVAEGNTWDHRIKDVLRILQVDES